MDIERVFHMKEGMGEKSYANNSSLQKKAFDMVKHITIETILDFYITTNPDTIAIADLGCSSGPNTLCVIREIIHAVRAMSRRIRRPVPEFRVLLNDLPSNDFKSIFMALPDLYQEFEQDMKNGALVFISAVPGTFYGRLFPNNSLDFVHSSYSLHWLSKVPPGLYDTQGKSLNKGKVYISEESCPLVAEAYRSQFRQDFQFFLQSRSKEVISGGRMVLIFLGRRDDQDHNDRGNSFFWELLSRSLEVLVSEGAIEKEKLDMYDVHFYAPSKCEIEEKVRSEGSFIIDWLDMFEIERDESGCAASYGKMATATVRAIQDCMITKHFGEGIVDRLFQIYEKLVVDELVQHDINPVTFIVVLRKIF